MLVSDYNNHRVQIFDRNGKWLCTIGKQGSDEGSFNGPMGIFVDNDTGDFYVSDLLNHRVMMF